MGAAGGGSKGGGNMAKGEPYLGLMQQYPKTFGFDPNLLNMQKGGTNDAAHFYDVANQFKTNTVTFNPALTNPADLKRKDPAAGIKGEMISLAKGDSPVFGYFKGNDTYVDIKTGKAVDKYAVQGLMGDGPVNQFRPGSGGKPVIYNYEGSFDETKLGGSGTLTTPTTTPIPGTGTAADGGTMLGDGEAATELQRKRQMQQGQKATAGTGTIQKPTLLGS